MTSSNDFQILEKELALMEEAIKILRYSYDKCNHKPLHDNMSMEDLEEFEALNARFARAGDIFIQKLLRLIDKLDLEKPGTVRDLIYRAEKKGIVSDADSLIEMRNLLNQIAHEYVPEALRGISNSVLHYTPTLFSDFNNLKNYIKEKYSTSIFN